MTRQEALAYDNVLKDKLKLAAEMLGMEEKTGTDIVERYIMIIPDDDRKGMIFLGEKSASYKWGNIRLDFKKAIAAGLELVASLNLPESFLNYIQLLIVTAFFIQKSIMMEIGKTEAYIVYFLHMRNGYETGIEEKFFLEDFQKWYKERMDTLLEEKEIEEAVQHLYDGKVLDITDEKIYLKEKVIGHMES